MTFIATKKLKQITGLARDGYAPDEIAAALAIDEATVNQVLGHPTPDAGMPPAVSSLNSAGASAPAAFSSPCGAGGAGDDGAQPIIPPNCAPSAGSGDPAPTPPAPEGLEPSTTGDRHVDHHRPAPLVPERLGRSPGIERLTDTYGTGAVSAAPVSVGTCETCRVWDQRGLSTGYLGRCKRYAPAVVPSPTKEGKMASMWPITRAEEWCAEHVAGDVR